jgi:hypothetical protein
MDRTNEGDFETAKLGTCLRRATVSRKNGYSGNNESEKSERQLRDVDGENGETQSMVPNNVVSWYLI